MNKGMVMQANPMQSKQLHKIDTQVRSSTSAWSLTKRAVAGIGCALLLAGCSGINPSTSPAKTFEVDVPVKRAYERALAQSKMCLVTKDNFPITSEVQEDGSFAFVRVNMNMTDTLLSNVRIVAKSPSRSRVSVQMWGVDVWNTTAIDAMQAAIEFGVPSCVNYFPSKAK